MIRLSFILVLLISFIPKTWVQVIPDEKLLDVAELPAYLKVEKRSELTENGSLSNQRLALLDKELQGKEWTSNKGSSGFGKFKKLPQPKVISWESNAVLLKPGDHFLFNLK